jgi:hypothetical protein
VRVHRNRRRQFAVAQNLDRRVAIDHARLLQHFGGNFGFAERGQAVEVHDVVFLAENVGEAALRNAPVQRHLAAFKSADQPRARAGPLPLVTARRSLAHAGAHAAPDSLLLFRCLLRCPYCR